jgi:hypothetical protein
MGGSANFRSPFFKVGLFAKDRHPARAGAATFAHIRPRPSKRAGWRAPGHPFGRIVVDALRRGT